MNARRLLAPVASLAVAAAAAGGGAALVLASGDADARPAGAAHSSASPAARAGTVAIMNMMFMPGTVSTTLNGSVTWSNQDSLGHTVTSDQGFWDSGTKLPGATYTRTFASAGTFAYHCSIHPEMHGKVGVPLTARGSASKGYRLTWATGKGFTYDVQTRLGHGTWVSLRAATPSTHARFDPARAGRYSVRALTRKGGAKSGWSPTVTVTVS